MFESLFPISSGWSWGTFFLYVAVSMIVVGFCKKGALYDARRRYKRSANTKVISNLCYFAAWLILTLLATLRSSEVGSDTPVYVSYFNNVRQFSFAWNELFSFHQQEPGFQIYLYLIRLLSSNYRVLFFITYGMISWAYIHYIRYFYDEKSDYIFLQLFIFYFVSNMSGMRAAMGMVFLLPSFIALDKEKYGKAILLTLFACAFHYTMLFNFYIVLALWILRHNALRRKKWIWGVAIVATVVVAYFGTYWLKGLFNETKYGFYSMVSLADQSLLGSIFYVFFGVFAFVFMRRIIREKGKVESALLVSLSFLITYPVLFVAAAYRVPNYYIMPRLTVWSKGMNYIYKFTSDRRTKILVRFLEQMIILLYLLFRFTRSAGDGNFMYVI